MYKKITYIFVGVSFIVLTFSACKTPNNALRTENKTVPSTFLNSTDSSTIADLKWKEYFTDQLLINLIDTALKNNKELNIVLQEIEISRNEVRARKGEYLPFIGIGGASEIEKSGRYTRHGAVDENLDIKPDKEFPEPLPNYMFGLSAKWELDVWKKLRNGKKAAVSRYLASAEGKNFLVTNLIAEIADAYYELLALDNLLEIINKNIDIQSKALNVVTQQKNAAKLTQLAVNRFEAQLLNTQNLQYDIKQRVIETENKIKFLTGSFSPSIQRNSADFEKLEVSPVAYGIPSQLLAKRPDVRQAELELQAAKLDVKTAKANFYPNFTIQAGIGYEAFNPDYLIKPKSLFYNLAGDLMAPLVNRNAIKAVYYSANAKQIQAIYNYEQTILNAYLDVINQLSKIDNYNKSYELKSKEVEILTQSVVIANSLFNSARADYAEVLLTQREALDEKLELYEIKLKQLNAKVNMYRALGGGWN